jgi:hypothetical protein
MPSPTAAPTPHASLDRDYLVGQWTVEIPIDNGPSAYAMGTTTTDRNGVPVAYVVAPGDDISYITDRFGFESHDYLDTINQVRRGGYPFPLYAGDTLNLSAFTVTSVGSINGRVLDDPPPDPLPPQR